MDKKGTPVIANLSLLQRRPDISREQFSGHWIDPHGPLAAQLPHVKSYVQYHVVESAWAGDPDPRLAIDGVPALWFASQQELAEAYATPILAECNVDSEAFIGAVSRVTAIPYPHGKAGAAGACHAMFILVGEGGGNAGWRNTVTPLLLEAGTVAGFTSYEIVSQAAAPNSKIRDLGVAIAGFVQVTFHDRQAARQGSIMIDVKTPDDCRLALYEVNPVRFV